jgi:predicted phage-related endonuclease
MALGLSPYGGPGELQARKLGGADLEEPSWAMRLGSLFESAIAEAVAEREGWAITGFHRTLWHPNGIMFATPDYRITGARAGLEIKKSEQRDEWGDDGDPMGAPVHVRIQVQQQMACVPGWERVYVAVLLYGRDLRTYPIDRHPGQIAHLERALPEWWQRHIVDREPVEADGSDGSRRAIRALYPHPIEEPRIATAEEELLALEYIEVSAAAKVVAERKELLSQRLQASIATAASIAGTGWKATLGEQRGRIDWKAAAEAAGVTEVTAEGHRGEPSRVLRVTSTVKEAAA